MSYPTLSNFPLSMAAGLKKTPNFNTVRQKTVVGITSAIALKPYPTWDFEFSLDHIQGNESLASSVMAQFFSIFMQTCGGAGLFYFVDPQDTVITNAQFGKADGTSTAYQLSRNINGAVDILQNIYGARTIYVNGTQTSMYSMSPTGVVTFNTPPVANAVLSWSGSLQYLCRFSEDTIDATRSYTVNSGIDQWMVQGVKFSSEFILGATYGAIAAPGGF